MSSLGEKLYQCRVRKGLSQTQVANLLGFSTSSMSGYEKNVRKPTNAKLARFAELYEVPIAFRLYLWDESSESSRYKGVYRIFLDKRLETCKQWREFAHQLCCVLKKAGDQLEVPPLCRVLTQISTNYFTCHFCIPTFMLKRLPLPSEKQESVAYMSKVFNVEAELAEKRINQWM
ncbi:XRE family transcriptional regulator [Domibacillus sp. PGB-M46]|uniref:helix-turn-helix domain-containing protein n=1 Tax=Domibacillus sp. PGB-M46 TaxID=2910255 RepID=UPI001F598728|nr:XRE family transcriptional regulator [Domibacillus sp. PGB-M46]MCI2257198.1 XRE family transcriptional regulator [Domibacillus sp. PGB-M46]